MNTTLEVINKVVSIPINKIAANPNQPRNQENLLDLQSLMGSIKENGILQPVTLREIDNGCYELIAGERRTRACLALGFTHVPAIIEEMSTEKSAVLALVENLQRKNLDFFEQAFAIYSLANSHNLTQEEIAKLLGKTQSSVANKLRLLKLDQKTITFIKAHNLTERHSRALLAISDNKRQLDAAKYIFSHSLNVAQTESYINKLLTNNNSSSSGSIVFVSDVRIFFSTVKKAVLFMKDAGINIATKEYEDDEYINYLVRIPKSQSFKKRTTA